MKYNCMYCDAPREAGDLVTISSVFEAPDGRSSDTLTVCKESCAQRIRNASTVIVHDGPFEPA